MIEHRRRLQFQFHMVMKWIQYGFKPITESIPKILESLRTNR